MLTTTRDFDKMNMSNVYGRDLIQRPDDQRLFEDRALVWTFLSLETSSMMEQQEAHDARDDAVQKDRANKQLMP